LERLPLSVNKSNLLRLKEELVFASDGLELLNEKKEALMARISSLAGKAERVRARMQKALQEAYRHLRHAIMEHGRVGCERASLAAALGEVLEIREKSFMGVALPVVRLNLPRFLPRYGFLGTGMAVDSLAQTVYQSLEVITELAEIEVGLFRLVAEIKKTIKRINALENIYIPLYQATVKHIEESLEEKEREFLFQLKRQKSRQEEVDHGNV